MQGWCALSRFRQLERSDPDDFTVEWSGPQFEHLRFHAEAFYYFAFRFRCIVRRVEIVYGGQVVRPFNGFECPGIRFSRNHLIEHSDKTDGVIADNFASGIPEGLVIQPFTTDVRAPLDRGLYPNALEFVTKIDERLSNIGLANKVDE